MIGQAFVQPAPADRGEEGIIRASLALLAPHLRDAYVLAYVESAVSEFSVKAFGEAETIERVRMIYRIAGEVK